MLRSGLFLLEASDEWVPYPRKGGKYPNDEGYNGDINIQEIGPEGAGAKEEFNEIFKEDDEDEYKAQKLNN